MKIIKHLKRWNKWRKLNGNSKMYKFLVLIGFIISPSFELTWTDEECEAYYKGLCEGLRGEQDGDIN
jgi:hypothetical protein